MATCGEEQAVLDGREIKGDAISLQEAFLQFKRKKQVSDLYIKAAGNDHRITLFFRMNFARGWPWSRRQQANAEIHST